jgi:hypothetical protein
MAAHRLEDLGNSPFSAEALIVAVWQDHPHTFGLKGFDAQFPDSNRVLACIMGEKGLARRGWLTKMGQKLYALSEDGKSEVERLLHPPETRPSRPRTRIAKPETKKRVAPDLEKRYLAMIGAVAYRRFREGMKWEITYRDACTFWAITEDMTGSAVSDAVDRIPGVLSEFEGLLENGFVELSNGRTVGQDDLKQLANVHDYLLGQFRRHLSLQRQRVGRN